MFAGATKNGVQLVGLWISDDLEDWQEHPDNPVLKPEEPYYRAEPTEERPSVGWRDPGIIYNPEDGYYHMVISAQLPEEQAAPFLGTTAGHARSRDLIHWEHLPPFHTPGLQDRFYQIEEPEVFELNGMYYLLIEGGTTGGMRTSTPSRDDARGTFYMMSPKLEGPYTSPDEDMLLGNGLGTRCATTSRVLQHGDDALCLHFSIADRPVLGTPKTVRTREDGTLFLEYMPVNEKLESEQLCGSVADLPEFESRDAGQWARAGDRLSCRVERGGSVHQVADDVADFHFACHVEAPTADRAGVVLRVDPKGDSGVWPRGTGVVLDFAEQRMFISDARRYHTTGYYCKPLDDICRVALHRDRPHHLRVLARNEHLEVYLDNRWIFTATIPQAPTSGAVEFIAESGEAVFSNLHLAAIEPLE
jgi:sucrose-6-phosphate hydrolase SacC (GH32 family)